MTASDRAPLQLFQLRARGSFFVLCLRHATLRRFVVQATLVCTAELVPVLIELGLRNFQPRQRRLESRSGLFCPLTEAFEGHGQLFTLLPQPFKFLFLRTSISPDLGFPALCL